MHFYDVIGSWSQVGGDLQNYSSNGTPYSPGVDTHWDVVTRASFSGPVTIADQSPNLVDIVIYQGQLHVVWVEPQWNGSARVMRGPFVKKWNGSTWTSLGGEVDPTLTPINWTDNPVVSGAIGTHGVPGRPKIVTDGTDLYVAYTVRELAHGANPPPNGSWVSPQACGCYVGPCDHTDYTIWYPRKTYVRKWNSGTGLWDLFGVLLPKTNNDLNVGTAAIVTPKITMHAYASPGEPGTVYVTMWERGPQSVFVDFTTSPDCILGIQFGTQNGSAQYIGLRTAKFNAGTGTAGSIKDLYTYSLAALPLAGGYYDIEGYEPSTPDAYIANENGTPYLFVGDLTVHPNTMRMTNWNTLVDAQTFTGSPYTGGNVFAPFALSYDAAGSMYYLALNFEFVVQTPSDGSGAVLPLDYASYGTSYWIPFNAGFFFSDKLAVEMHNFGNVWGIGGQDFIQFHHQCPGWKDWGNEGPSDLTPIGNVFPIIQGNTMYTVGAYASLSDRTIDYKVRVYSTPIIRNGGSCGGAPANLLITEQIALT